MQIVKKVKVESLEKLEKTLSTSFSSIKWAVELIMKVVKLETVLSEAILVNSIYRFSNKYFNTYEGWKATNCVLGTENLPKDLFPFQFHWINVACFFWYNFL